MASQVHRLVLLMLPILIIELLALRAAPQLYADVMIDDNLTLADSKLVVLDGRLSRIRLPAAYRQTAFNARIHVDLVRSRIAKMQVELQNTGLLAFPGAALRREPP
jgi:hypothetical protein